MNINTFHYYRFNVFAASLKVEVEIFHAEFLSWSDFFFPYVSGKLNLATSFVEKCTILPVVKAQQPAAISLGSS